MAQPGRLNLGAMGFAQVSYPASLILRVVQALRDGLSGPAHLCRRRRTDDPAAPGAELRQVLDRATDLAD